MGEGLLLTSWLSVNVTVNKLIKQQFKESNVGRAWSLEASECHPENLAVGLA